MRALAKSEALRAAASIWRRPRGRVSMMDWVCHTSQVGWYLGRNDWRETAQETKKLSTRSMGLIMTGKLERLKIRLIHEYLILPSKSRTNSKILLDCPPKSFHFTCCQCEKPTDQFPWTPLHIFQVSQVCREYPSYWLHSILKYYHAASTCLSFHLSGNWNRIQLLTSNSKLWCTLQKADGW